MKNLKQLLRQGKSVLGTMVGAFDNPNIARMLAGAGFDFFIIDCEHGAFTYKSVSNIVAVAKGADIATIIRIPKVDRECIQKFSDMSIDGILIPQTEEVEQVKDAIRFSKYKPLGDRGITKSPNVGYRQGVDWKARMQEINEDSLIILQIETKKAVENIDNLLSIEGVDVVMFGPNDLSQNLGIWGEFDNKIYTDAIDIVVDSARRHNVYSGNHCRIEDLEKGMENGMKFIIWNNDVGMLMSGASAGVKRIKSHPNYVE